MMDLKFSNGVIYSHNVTDELIAKVNEQVKVNGVAIVYNTHETFYGWDFENDLHRALKGENYDIKCVENDCKEGFPKKFVITKKIA